jgi:two-component system response regulator ArlR
MKGADMKILIIEDELMIAEAVAHVLKKNNYNVDIALDGEYGLDCALSGIYDIIILDIMLPKKDGFSILYSLRNAKIPVPVIILTAKNQTQDKVKGLDFGADDYLEKPFEMEELLARLRALSRRKGDLVYNGILEYGDIEFNPHQLLLSCKDKKLKLTLKEGHALELLITGKYRTVSKETMIEKLWGYESDAEDNHVEIHISLLRKKLKQVDSTLKIKAIRGLGYILKSPEEE